MSSSSTTEETKPVIEWDWDVEHEDRKREAKADAAFHGAAPFEVDRRVLKDVVQEKMSTPVGRITFLSSGTFHKAYLIQLIDARELVARVARRFMPRLKTESEVATMSYFRTYTSIPVPDVYHYDANPYNRLGGEYILMSKAPGIPLSRVYHSMSHEKLLKLLDNAVNLVIPLYGHRFSHLGSLYPGPPPQPSITTCSAHTPVPGQTFAIPNPLSRSITMTPGAGSALATPKVEKPASKPEFHLGPIVSWPFFGSGRGDLAHPVEIDRGPWATTRDYLRSCAQREIEGVRRENEGKAAPHRLHLDPDEIESSRHHKVRAVPGDASDESTEWDWEESEEEWEGPGDAMYRDYRRMQRSTFLVAHMVEREKRVREEMERWVRMMEKLGIGGEHSDGGGGGWHGPEKHGEVLEEFALDCHDMSLENVFVDENDPSKITCVIDWESTTTRPLWAVAHVPAFLQSSPFTARLFRAAVESLASSPATSSRKLSLPFTTPTGIVHREVDFATLANEWLHHEASGARARMAHRCVEWDGWEEGLVNSILGPEEEEDEWFKPWEEAKDAETVQMGTAGFEGHEGDLSPSSSLGSGSGSSEETKVEEKGIDKLGENFKRVNVTAPRVPLAAKVVAEEKEKEKLLVATGDICGGRGGELGRRLEAWLTSTTEGRRRLSDADTHEHPDHTNA